MGKKNVRTKKYMSRNDTFADVCNYFLFDGKTVIKPEQLKERDVTELGIPFSEKGSKSVEKIRDILKSCVIKSADGVMYFVIGIENQSEIHYAMVVRNMVQDALNYAAQVEACTEKHRKTKDIRKAEFLSGFSKTDYLVPVITLTIFWNTGIWDGPRSLHEMLQVPDKELLRYVPDYRLNLIVPEEIEDFDKFSMELGLVLQYCSCADDKEKMRQLMKSKEEDGFYLDRESVEVLNECVNAGIKIPEVKGEKVDMCKAVEGLMAESMEAGIKKGIERGVERGKVMMLVSLVKDGTLTVQAAAGKAKLTEEEFLELMKQ